MKWIDYLIDIWEFLFPKEFVGTKPTQSPPPVKSVPLDRETEKQNHAEVNPIPKITQPMYKKSKRKIVGLVVHTTASAYGSDLSAEDIRKYHVNTKGWSDIGYHYVVRLDGTIELGRDVDKSGAHVLGHNKNTIGLTYVGGLDKNGKPKDTRTDAQKKALRSLLWELRLLYPKATIKGHRDYSPDKNGNGIIERWEYVKMCPCYNAMEEYADI